MKKQLYSEQFGGCACCGREMGITAETLEYLSTNLLFCGDCYTKGRQANGQFNHYKLQAFKPFYIERLLSRSKYQFEQAQYNPDSNPF